MHRGDQDELRVVTDRSAAGASAPAADLTPFVPRLIPEWMADAPDAAHRAIDGTLVFTDLSGFTAMSERLGALGKVGAEELTDHLDAIFTELITVAGLRGGSMLKFGGDALLILFWGPQHELRAATSALEMQETLGRIGLVKTSAGEARLQMTVGAHSGVFDLFLVGLSHKALFVCGPDAATAVAVESSANAGEVRVSSELAARLNRPLLGETSNGSTILLRAPDLASDIPAVRPWPRGTAAATFIPAMLRSHLATGVQLAEHRQMAVGFIHLDGFDELIVEIGPEPAALHLNDLVTVVQQSFAAHDVAFISTDIYEGGPKIVCATGAVRTFENDEERLLRALRDIVDYASPIDLRIGVNRGHGFSGFVGPPFRRTFAIIGDVVNTAARVMAKADAGEILSTAGVLDRSETLFETTELPPFAAKGKAEPLVAHRVGAIIGSRETADTDLPFVGRQTELERLTRFLSELRAGKGCYVEVVGEPGIGKTRLVHELIELAGDVTVSQERCGRYAASTAYFPFRRLLGDLFAGRPFDELNQRIEASAPELGPYLPLLAVPLGLASQPTPEIEHLSVNDRRTKLHEVVTKAIAVLLDGPAVWFVDDTHWLDAASTELLRHISGDIGRLELMLCTARRPEGDAIGPAETVLDLSELGGDDATELLRAAATLHLLPKETATLQERARGNPMFLITLAAAVSEGQDLERLPDSLEAVLAARIDALLPRERQVLRHLAVIGSRFLPDIAREAIDDLPGPSDPSWGRLAEFVDTSGDEWRFTQSLVRDTAYEGLSYKERREVHARTGEAIEARYDDPFGMSELLSLHFHSAAANEPSLKYSQHAADKANSAFAFREAATFFERCAEAARVLDDRVALGNALTGVGLAEQEQGLCLEAREHFEASLEIKRALGNLQGIAAQLNSLGLVSRQLGEPENANALFMEALTILRDVDAEGELGAVLRNIGTVAWLRGEYGEAENWFEQALEFERRRGDANGVASALEGLATVAFVRGDLELARGRYEESLQRLRDLGHKPAIATVLNNLGNVALQQGDNALARENFEESLAVRREIGDRYGVASALTNLGTIEYFAKNYDKGAEHYTEGLRISRQIGDQRGMAQSLHNLGEIEIIRGDLTAAIERCDEALEIRRTLGDPRGMAESVTTLGKLAFQTGDDERSRALYIEALGLLEPLGNKPGLAECLEQIAVACAAASDDVRAVTLMGATDGILQSIGVARSWAGDDRAELETRLRLTLNDEVFDMTLGVGRAMSLERALELALAFLRNVEPDEAATA